MKKLLAMFMACTMMFALTACGDSDDSSSDGSSNSYEPIGEVYDHDEFSMEIPDGYTSSDLSGMVIWEDDAASGNSIVVYPLDLGMEVGPSDFTQEELLEELQYTYQDIDIISYGTTTVDGKDAVEMITEMTYAGIELTLNQYLVFSGTMMYTVQFSDMDGSLSQYVDAMVASFKTK